MYGTEKTAVKNRSANPIQITAEQLLREAVDRQGEEKGPPKQHIADEQELQSYRLEKRKEFEDSLRRQRNHIGTWVKYAKWEEDQQEFRRARSIFERALQVDYQNASLWLKYIEMETSHKFIQHARNLYDRVTQLLPRIDQFWYKFAFLEEQLENFTGARDIYERWMKWEPSENAWTQYIKFEERCGETERARQLFERYVQLIPSSSAFVRFSKFEEKANDLNRARACFETALEVSEDLDDNFFLKWAAFEEKHGSQETVRRALVLGCAKLPTAELLSLKLSSFTKQNGSAEDNQLLMLERRRAFYEEQVASETRNRDIWFDFARLEEEAGTVERAREVYERAVADIPGVGKSEQFRRYIYLWLFYAAFDSARGVEILCKAFDVCSACGVVSGKLVSALARIFIKLGDMQSARLAFGRGIGESAGRKAKLFREYLDLEIGNAEMSRCREILTKWTESMPNRAEPWERFIDFELAANESARAITLANLALEQNLDQPDDIWKKLIQIGTNLGHSDQVRNLFKKLITFTSHEKVWLAFSDFELNAKNFNAAEQVLEEAVLRLKSSPEGRARCLARLLALATAACASEAKLVELRNRQARKLTKKKGDLEIVSFEFPDDVGSRDKANVKLLEFAKRLKST